MAKRKIIGSFPSYVAGGENPNGFTAQTANGTAHDVGDGNNESWKWGQQADGPRWNGELSSGFDLTQKPTRHSGPTPKATRNRTGE